MLRKQMERDHIVSNETDAALGWKVTVVLLIKIMRKKTKGSFMIRIRGKQTRGKEYGKQIKDWTCKESVQV